MALWAHFENRIRGVDVFALSDGTYVQETATPENGNTAIPYPWNPDYPSAPFSYVTNFDGTVTTATVDPYIIFRYAGGSTWPITLAQYNAFLAYVPAVGIGYAGNVSTGP